MVLATSVFKTLAYKKEVTYGVAPGAAGAQLLRRVDSNLDTKRALFKANEIRSDWQIGDARLGVKTVEGTIKGDLSPGTYKDFFAASTRNVFAAVAASVGMSITIAGAGPTYTLTRSAGSWITDGATLFSVGRFTAGGFNAANSNNNMMIVGITALVLTVITLNSSALVAEGPIASATWTPTGKKTFMPANGQTDNSFSIEHWFSDISQSELFVGCKVTGFDVAVPPTGLATASFTIKGQTTQTAAAEYFTSPAAVTTTGLVAGVNGVLLAGAAPSSPYAICTGVQIKCALNVAGEPVVGAQTQPALFPGLMMVSGSFTAFFQDNVFRDNFLNETAQMLAVALTTNNTATSDFLVFAMSNIKMNSASKGEAVGKGIVQTFNFEALFNTNYATNYGDATTLMIQDSAA